MTFLDEVKAELERMFPDQLDWESFDKGWGIETIAICTVLERKLNLLGDSES